MTSLGFFKGIELLEQELRACRRNTVRKMVPCMLEHGLEPVGSLLRLLISFMTIIDRTV